MEGIIVSLSQIMTCSSDLVRGDAVRIFGDGIVKYGVAGRTDVVSCLVPDSHIGCGVTSDILVAKCLSASDHSRSCAGGCRRRRSSRSERVRL